MNFNYSLTISFSDSSELIGSFVKSRIYESLKLSYCSEYKSYVRPNEEVVTSKISPVKLFTLLH